MPRDFNTPPQCAAIARITDYLTKHGASTAAQIGLAIELKAPTVREYLAHMASLKLARRLNQPRTGQHGLAPALWLIGAAPVMVADPWLAWIPTAASRKDQAKTLEAQPRPEV